LSIAFEILGRPGKDNALYVRLDTGQRVVRFLFDCGEGCLRRLPVSEIQEIDFLCFSHLHIDHVAGFDTFFRHNYNRPGKPVVIWGPDYTAEAMHHRFQGYIWNLVGRRAPGEFRVADVTRNEIRPCRILTREGFQKRHPLPPRPFDGLLIDDPDFQLTCSIQDHKTDCLAYAVSEKTRLNIDPAKLDRLGFRPGSWCAAVKDASKADGLEMEVEGRPVRLGELREKLLSPSPGQKLAFITDLLLTERAERELATLAQDCDFLVAECSFREAETDLAREHHHMTTRQVAEFAARARARALTLFHVSDRYDPRGRQELLAEVRALYPGANFPESWENR
jgi:ribonuclease Z